MIRPSPSRRTLAAILVLAAAAAAQRGGVSREQMWFAPTAEDWAKPVLIEFQRTWDDAVAVARETGKPILICVNMDGEIASEHYAGVRYRQPEIARLYADYVCVIASVYRHTPRDHDEHGHRIPCPRFGSVTCGEHIAIEPLLFEKFFDGKRIAPRHIMVEVDGSEAYDVYYAFDTDSVFKAIHDGIANRKIEPEPVVRGDRTLVERVASRDRADREAVEKAYREGDRDTRRRLLEAAGQHMDAAPVELLRQAVFGFDAEMAKLARKALTKATTPDAVEVINEALTVPMENAEREELVGALARLGKQSAQARKLAAVHRGLGTRSRSVDVERWSQAIAGGASYAPAPGLAKLEAELDARATAASKEANAEAQLALAEASLDYAISPEARAMLAREARTARQYSRLMFEDARRAAEKAAELGASGWRLDAVLAVALRNLGQRAEAFKHAEAAMRAMPAGTDDRKAMLVMEIFAHGRQRQITRAVVGKREWPPEWLTDLDAAYAVLARHPLGTDRHVVDHHDFLKWLGAGARAAAVLDRGLSRFPASPLIHDRLRARVLAEGGAAALEPTYDRLLARDGAPDALLWFAGYAAIVAAEFHRRGGSTAEADAAYQRAIGLFERSIARNPATKANSDHYIALALAGRARLAYEAGDDARALEFILACFDRKPEAAAARDGLNISPVETAKVLRERLDQTERAEMVQRIDEAFGRLDPAALELPAFERPPVEAGRRAPRGARRRR